jgi:cytochrome c-type protein NapC
LRERAGDVDGSSLAHSLARLARPTHNDGGANVSVLSSPLTVVTLVCAASSAVILGGYLLRRPALTRVTKWLLFLGLGVFPIGTAASGNVVGFESTKARTFCGSCHVMIPHASDSIDPKSTSLAARHARNKLFGDDNCYACHADYGMFGTVTTKAGGMRHVYLYLTEYRNTPLEEAKKTIHIRKPFPNSTCMQCHSTENEIWNRVPDHASSIVDVRAGRVSCASSGCHGYAHPRTKPPAAQGDANTARDRADAAPPIRAGGHE